MHQQVFIKRVLDYIARQQAGIPELDVLRLVALTGLHPQTLLRLKPTDINHESREITCIHKETQAVVSLPDTVLDILTALEHDGEVLFSRGGQPVELRDVFEHWEALCIAEGLTDEHGQLPHISKLIQDPT